LLPADVRAHENDGATVSLGASQGWLPLPSAIDRYNPKGLTADRRFAVGDVIRVRVIDYPKDKPALLALDRFGLSKALPASVAAVSVGVVAGTPMLDLDYSEDSSADVDVNVVTTGAGELIEVQATAERDPFPRESLDELLDLAAAGIEQMTEAQQEALRA